MTDRIAALPTAGHTFDPAVEAYWDPAALAGEIERVFDICHGCRLCFNLCPCFPALFEAVDAHDGEIRRLSAGDVEKVADLCYQCKLCYVKCPYTPDDGHEFQLDFPRLLTRYVAQRAERHGIGLAGRLLGNPEKVGRMGTALPALANAANRNPTHRWLMERVTGIHRHKHLPPFARERFSTWLSRHPDEAPRDGSNGKVALFHTCVVENHFPAIGRAALEVLGRSGVAVVVPEQRCCGMPALEQGDVAGVLDRARANLTSLLPLVRQGYTVVALEPTCSYTLRREYPVLLASDEARELAAGVRDLHEYLWQLKGEGKLDRRFASTPGTVAYHVPCHLKAQSIGFRSRDVMRLIPGTTVKLVDACTCHDGTWAMHREHFSLSLEWGRKAFDGLRESESAVWSTDCSLAALHVKQATGGQALHPVEILARAYRPDGFPTPVPAPQEDARR
jgi:glycerol-3-phosphate dehydrogenase subunit C